MLMEIAEAVILAERCAPAVAAPTLMSIVRVESGFNPLAIGVNGLPRVIIKSANAADAARQAATLIAAGRSVDLGLAQINSKNLRRLGLTVEDAFDPCRNLAASATVLRAGWSRASAADITPVGAMQATLSLYNTGTTARGLRNGYVAKVAAAAVGGGRRLEGPRPVPPPAPAPDWQVFAASRPNRFVLTPTAGAIE